MFKYLISIEPLGLLYGSAGRFLSPENLVGRSGQSFPPSSATLSGIFAAQYGNADVQPLKVAGPFWGRADEVDRNQQSADQNFYVPAPYRYVVQNNQSQKLYWCADASHLEQGQWLTEESKSPTGKSSRDYWISIRDWDNPTSFEKGPWEFLPHLHPRLQLEQRKVEEGDLFLENGVQLSPEARLVYLSNMPLPDGWYRFGGEGHMVSVKTHDLSEPIQKQLSEPVGQAFAIIVPAVWGSNRLSQRWPAAWEAEIATIMTARPVNFRYRLGDNPRGTNKQAKRLSRGRYAVPAGSVYVRKTPLALPWYEWDNEWFPKEGPRLNRWGCGLSLPLKDAVRVREDAAIAS